MTDISYRVVPKGKGGFDVEIERPGGRKQTVPGFASEHEAEAWIVQARRMIRDANPLAPVPPRKPSGPASTVPADPLAALPIAPPASSASVPPPSAPPARPKRKPEPQGFGTAG